MALIDSLVGYWKMDEASGDALDAHGSNNLTETSGTIGSGTGKINNARDFEDGDTEYFAHTDNTDLSTGDIDFSFFCWVNAESLTGSSGFPVVGSKGWGTGGADQEWIIFQNGSGQPMAFAVIGAAGGAKQVNNTTFGAISTGSWFFIACGHSASLDEIWISVNGGTPDTLATSNGVNDGTLDFVIGSSIAQSLYWDGLIDEFAFFKRDIRSDLASFYNAGAGLAYPFSAGSVIGHVIAGGRLLW